MPARVLFIGLDAAEATLLKRWASRGKLPIIAALEATGRTYRLENSMKTLPGAIWPEIVSGRSCGKVPLYYHPRQLHTGETEIRPILREEVEPKDYFWTRASAAGRRVAVIDMPQTVASPELNGIQLFEWGLHDRNFQISSDPPSLLASLKSRYGDHPVTKCDLHGRKDAEYASLLDGLLKGAEMKSEILVELLQGEDWDLFACTFGESHCAGHQFWHFLDPEHPWHSPRAPQALQCAIQATYQAIDKGIGRLVAAAGPDAAVLVLASHGMGPYIGGPRLLSEVLVRLGMGPGSKANSRVSRIFRGARRRLSRSPEALWPFLKRLGNLGPVKDIQAAAGVSRNPLASPLTKAVALPNNRCGAIRLNLKGREPFGRVEPGDEAERLLERISKELLALRDTKTNEPIVTRTVTAQEAFGLHHHPDVPDLMVVFRTDLGRLESCRSPSVGNIHVDLFNPSIPRSGDHSVESRLWARGPGMGAGPHETSTANVLDIAPTVLRLLDVPLPEALDGRPLV